MDSVCLRHVAQGTLASARALGIIDEAEYEDISNTIIECIRPKIILRLSELASEMAAILKIESCRRK